jgi:TonB-linked SusC/RagA family outer membrane protein
MAKVRIIFLFFVIFVPLTAFSQTENVKISGTVIDEKTLETLVGATVRQSDSKSAVTVTDVDGAFTLAVKALPTTMVIDYIGYRQREVSVGDASKSITIGLAEDVTLLNEVVVVGYGTQRRTELTGAVTTVSQEVLNQHVVAFDALLSGSVAGLNVTNISGQPGAGTSIRIRGGNSIHASNEPLYVIDGVIVYPRSTSAGAGGAESAVESSINPLASINPADIESISVLKDVSATAIFGSRGANGVIIVSTRKGARGNDIVSYTLTTGWSVASKRLSLMNAQQWGKLQMDYFGNKGNLTDAYLASIGEGYDWQDAVLQTGFTQNHDIALSGGDARTKYSVSGNFVSQDGIIINSGFQRYNLRINVERKVRENLTLGAGVTFGKSVQNSLTTSKEVNYNSSPFGDGITNSLTYALFMPPTVPIYASDGSGYNYDNPWESSHFSLNGVQANPVADLMTSVAESINKSLLANFLVQYNIFNGLTAKATLSTDRSDITQNFFAPHTSALGMNEVGVGSVGRTERELWQADATLDYSKHFTEAHFVNLMGGYTFQRQDETYLVNRASHFTNETLQHNKLGFGEVQSLPVNGTYGSTLHSLISRLNYTLLDRYNLTATFRADYSDRFAESKRWGYFPSVGLSWNIDREHFFPENKLFSALKLRLSAGTVGNTEIGDYLFKQFYNPQLYNGKPVIVMENLGNPDLTWETTTQYNAGLDVALLQERVNIVADVYRKDTRNLLLEKPAALGSGVEKQMVNIGSVRNQGVEFAVDVALIRNKALKWNVSANIARNINEVTDLGGDDNLLSGYNNEQILKVGEAFGSFYGYRFVGIVQADEDLCSLPTVNSTHPAAGDVKFEDITVNGNIDLNDRTVLGSIHPDFTYGLNSSLNYGGFDLFLSINGSQGNKVVNSLRRNLERAGSSYNVSAALLDAWTSDNPSSTIPRINYGYQQQMDSRHIEDASFLRFKNLTIGYTLQFKPADVRLFATAQNLFTFTPYKGYDPEVASGIDTGAYPAARSFSTGFTLTIH